MTIKIFAKNCAPYVAAAATHTLENGNMVHGYAFTDPATGKHHFFTACVRFKSDKVEKGWTDPMVQKTFLVPDDIGMGLNLSYKRTWLEPLGFCFEIVECEEMEDGDFKMWRNNIVKKG